MTPLVVDASVAAGWLLGDEDDPAAEAVLEALAAAPGLVPQLWHWEMRNVLLVARRRSRITEEGLRERVAALADLPLETDGAPDLDRALALAGAQGLSFYDALYLELAKRAGARLATRDARLAAAARAEGVAAWE
jgi:predicted nucleic acid-binding protein